MWWDHQNLDRVGPDGRRWQFRGWQFRGWQFRGWHGHHDGCYLQRVFFWDADRTETGIVELLDGATLHITRLRALLDRLAHRADLRQPHHRELRFPLQRHYSEYRPPTR